MYYENQQENYLDHIQDAMEHISAWDLPENELMQAACEQAQLMAGYHLIDSDLHHMASPCISHR
jgi:hypothetical protein